MPDDQQLIEQLRAELDRLKLTEVTRKRKLFDNGFPPLGTQVCSTTSASKAISHTCAKFVQIPFQKFEKYNPLEPPPLGSDLWNSLENSNNPGKQLPTWSSESDIQGFVRSALTDVIKHSGLDGSVTVLNELSIFHPIKKNQQRPDIWIMRNRTGFPIGVCEVKKPNGEGKPSALDDGNLHGQIYDYMLNLRTFFGLKRVFGITSTYEQWRICWLADNDRAAQETDIETYKMPDEKGESLKLPEGREIHGSSIYQYNDPKLVQVLVHLMHKMNLSPYSASQLIKVGQRYPLFEENSWNWVPLPTPFELSYQIPDKKSTKFYLLQQYHSGADGLVWLGASTSGKLAVLKFGIGENISKSSLEKEATHWKQLWGAEARVLKLFGRQALMMPFAFHAHVSEGNERALTFKGPNSWTTLLSDDEVAARDVSKNPNAIKEDDRVLPLLKPFLETSRIEIAKRALQPMLEQDIVHDDLAWRHVALLPLYSKIRNDRTSNSAESVEGEEAAGNNRWTLKPILIDLTRVRQIRTAGASNVTSESAGDGNNNSGERVDEAQDDDAREGDNAEVGVCAKKVSADDREKELNAAIKKLSDEWEM